MWLAEGGRLDVWCEVQKDVDIESKFAETIRPHILLRQKWIDFQVDLMSIQRGIDVDPNSIRFTKCDYSSISQIFKKWKSIRMVLKYSDLKFFNLRCWFKVDRTVWLAE